ncbi:MAG: TolB family protein, partial [Pirellulales bacterium]
MPDAFPLRPVFLACLLLISTRSQAQEPSIESHWLANVRQVTDGFIKAGEGYFSPDQKTIIFQATTAEYPFYQIYTQSFERGRHRRVSTGRGRTTCSCFSPDGRRILYASSHLDPRLDQ